MESFGSIAPGAREFYYTIHRVDFSHHRIVVSKSVAGKWSAPQTLSFSGTFNDREPKLSPDGRRLYFSSDRPSSPGDTAKPRRLDLWMAERDAQGMWSAPRHLEGTVNSSDQDFSPVVTGNGTLYFVSTRPGGVKVTANAGTHNVWRARSTDKSGLRFDAPENVGAAINTGRETNVFVSPDERTMLVSRDGAPDGLGGDDLYVSTFVAGAWQPMRHLPAPINTDKYEYGPSISPDGKYLYFTSYRTGDADAYRVPIAALEREGVRRAALDYLEGFYEGDSAKLMRTLRPEMFKYGFWRERDSTTYAGERMSYAEAITYAVKFRADKKTTPVNAPREITLLDVQDQTASAKVTAWWGTDYLQLAKYDGRWMILQVLWQGP